MLTDDEEWGEKNGIVGARFDLDLLVKLLVKLLRKLTGPLGSSLFVSVCWSSLCKSCQSSLRNFPTLPRVNFYS